MPGQQEITADMFCGKNIRVTGLELPMSKVNEIDIRDIWSRVGRNDKPFVITIPHNEKSIESAIDYWPVFCIRSKADIRRVATRATLERHPPTEKDNYHPFNLTDRDGSVQIPYPEKPDAPDYFYHRWWRWPRSPAWREPGVYLLKVRLGYDKYNPAPPPPRQPVDDLSPEQPPDPYWTSEPFVYRIEIRQEKPPKEM